MLFVGWADCEADEDEDKIEDEEERKAVVLFTVIEAARVTESHLNTKDDSHRNSKQLLLLLPLLLPCDRGEEEKEVAAILRIHPYPSNVLINTSSDCKR